ncbi:hypothetical protein Lsan_1213 [Legionella santicrucis]|uniref:Uncharacterized protein n=2 Tax=Legionella santicrucis TaxID=45074 RepID=A0A0W0Z3S8_9GAMM|nr:hypothetical protein Lsan_1213 [Legionella santicrucis]
MTSFPKKFISEVEDFERRLQKLNELMKEMEERGQTQGEEFKQAKLLKTYVEDNRNKKDLLTPSRQEGGIPANLKADKTNILDAFVRHFKPFIQTIGNCIKKIGKINTSLPETITKLRETRGELKCSQQKLKTMVAYLINAREELAKQCTTLIGAVAAHHQEGNEIQKQRALLQKIQSPNYLIKDKTINGRVIKGEVIKDETIKTLKNNISKLQKKHHEFGCSIKEKERQLKDATANLNLAYEGLKEAILLHRAAVKSVDKAIKNVEQATKYEEQCIDKQQRIKEVLLKVKAESEEAKELTKLTEELLEPSYPRR